MENRLRALVLSSLLLPGVAAGSGNPTRLLWFVRTVEGRTLSARGADTPINPASVLKLGTALFALERLGADHRYETAFAAESPIEPERGVLEGDLVVLGGGDPDFQLENAWLVAGALNRAGIREVRGDLVIAGRFWMGWDHGVAGTAERPAGELRSRAGRRLRAAWDPSLWDAAIRRSWSDWCARRGGAAGEPPAVVVRGRVRTGSVSGRPLVRHLSNPLLVTLRRFLTFSNNDIVRIAEPLGGAPALERFLRAVLDAPPGGVVVAAASGEGRNRITPRLGVAMIDALRSWLGAHGLALRDLLPVPGCVPGPLPRMFPHLARTPLAGAVACKTGTLDTTDGGVAVLAGSVVTRDAGEVLFLVAAPRAGATLRLWRRREQSWLEELLTGLGGAAPGPCPPPLPYSDQHVTVEAAAGPEIPGGERPLHTEPAAEGTPEASGGGGPVV